MFPLFSLLIIRVKLKNLYTNALLETTKGSNNKSIEEALILWYNPTMLNKNTTLDGNLLKQQKQLG
jgi:hypothetical protein